MCIYLHGHEQKLEHGRNWVMDMDNQVMDMDGNEQKKSCPSKALVLHYYSELFNSQPLFSLKSLAAWNDNFKAKI